MSDEEYRELQKTLMERPDAGEVIPGSGGVRKLRWPALGRGKRGGYRIIYFVTAERSILWMLTIYPKNVTDNIPAPILRQIRRELEHG